MTWDGTRPLRSALYVPASRRRAMDKAATLAVDAILYDLEDALAPSEKADARAALAGRLAAPRPDGRLRVVRINGLDTPWGAADLAMAAGTACDAVLVPKADGPRAVAAVAERLPEEIAVWAMIETPAGVLEARAVAAAPRVGALVAGTNDLAAALGIRLAPGRPGLEAALQGCVLAARAAGVACLDGVSNAVADGDALRADCAQGRAWGFDGKTLIHPAQVAAANAAFGPAPEEVEEARRVIAAFEAAIAAGRGVAVLDGRLVEALHVDTARRLLARSDAMRARGGD